MKDQKRRDDMHNTKRGTEQDNVRRSTTEEQRTSSDRAVSREEKRQDSQPGSGRSYDYDSNAERDQKDGSTLSTGSQVAGGNRGESLNTRTGSGLSTKSSVTGSDRDGQL